MAPPSVEIANGASPVASDAAMLNGTLTATGGMPTAVAICSRDGGDSDAGPTPASDAEQAANQLDISLDVLSNDESMIESRGALKAARKPSGRKSAVVETSKRTTG